MREKVFERFFRLPGASASGSGLGLSIVKSIVRSHDAQLELGDAAGQGLIVTVWFAS
jgi:signal transduction histidine kinase